MEFPKKRHRVILLGSDQNAFLTEYPNRDARKGHDWKSYKRFTRAKKWSIKRERSAALWKSILESITKVMDKIWAISPELRDEIFYQVKRITRILPWAQISKLDTETETHPTGIGDAKLGGVCNHVARSIMRSDLHRYFFAACFFKKYMVSPLN